MRPPFPASSTGFVCLSVGSGEKRGGKNDFKVLDGSIEVLITENCARSCVCVSVCVRVGDKSGVGFCSCRV